MDTSSHQQLRSPHDAPSGVALRGRTKGAHQTGAGRHLPRRDHTQEIDQRGQSTRRPLEA
eukprot:5882989-Prymnesium_polylepis.1